ncbi:MAG: TPR end-of-group domain-containing protein, partial [Hassallia sp.]
PIDSETLEQESSRIIQDGDYEKYLTLTPEERTQQIIKFQELIAEDHQTPESQYDLLINLGFLQLVGQDYKQVIASYDKALAIKPDDHDAWYKRGIALDNLGRLEDAIASYDQALEFKPDKDSAFYNKARCYALQGNIEQAIENLQVAINLNPEKCGEWAKTDSDFDSIREDERFQVLIQGGSIPFLPVRSEGKEVERSDRKISH